jgi:hypothetical protein
MDLFDELLQPLFLGFAIFIFATSYIPRDDVRWSELGVSLTNLATLIVRLAAVAYVLMWLKSLYPDLTSESSRQVLMTRISGRGWFGYWIYPIGYGIFPQLLWLKKIRREKVMRIVVAVLLLLVIYIERIVILITSMHRDYGDNELTTLFGVSVLLEWFVGMLVFVVILGAAYGIRRLVKGRQE